MIYSNDDDDDVQELVTNELLEDKLSQIKMHKSKLIPTIQEQPNLCLSKV